jgi:hypothetical protein
MKHKNLQQLSITTTPDEMFALARAQVSNGMGTRAHPQNPHGHGARKSAQRRIGTTAKTQSKGNIKMS